MNPCAYCGHKCPDEAVCCTNCGNQLLKSPAFTSSTANLDWHDDYDSFFRRLPASIALTLVATFHIIGVILNLWLAYGSKDQSNLGSEYSRFMIRGAIWFAVIAALCLYARQKINRRNSTGLAAGAAAILVALAIVMRQWLGGLFSERNPFPLFEVLLFWLPLIYSAIYALKESLRVKRS